MNRRAFRRSASDGLLIVNPEIFVETYPSSHERWLLCGQKENIGSSLERRLCRIQSTALRLMRWDAASLRRLPPQQVAENGETTPWFTMPAVAAKIDRTAVELLLAVALDEFQASTAETE